MDFVSFLLMLDVLLLLQEGVGVSLLQMMGDPLPILLLCVYNFPRPLA